MQTRNEPQSLGREWRCKLSLLRGRAAVTLMALVGLAVGRLAAQVSLPVSIIDGHGAYVEVAGVPMHGVAVGGSTVWGLSYGTALNYTKSFESYLGYKSGYGDWDLAAGYPAASQLAFMDYDTASLHGWAVNGAGVSYWTLLAGAMIPRSGGVFEGRWQGTGGVGAAVRDGNTTYFPFVTGIGDFRLVELKLGPVVHDPLWTLPSMLVGINGLPVRVTGLDAFLRPGGTEGVLDDYAAVVSYSDGTARFFTLTTGAQIGPTFTFNGLSLFGTLTDIAFDPGTHDLFASFDDGTAVGYLVRYQFESYAGSTLAIPEPSTYAVLAGFSALAVVWSRKRKGAPAR